MTVETQFYALGGGLDLVTPAINVPAGSCIGVENYESSPRGYQRIDGLERFDGQPKPSAQSYWLLNVDAGLLEPALGRIITGASSGATGIVVLKATTGGTWAGGDWAGALVLRVVSGTFTDNEDVTVSEPIAHTSGFSSGFN